MPTQPLKLLFRLCAAALLAMLLPVGSAPAGAAADESPYRLVGYVTGRTDIRTVEATRLTHINYAFAQVSEAGRIVFDNDEAPAHLTQLHALKAQNPTLKLIVSVGGWGADNFSDAALTDASRRRFAESAARLVETYALDGIDLDWEFPGQPGPGIGHRPEDKQNFTLLLQAVRAQLDALSDAHERTGDARYLLTIASNDDEAYFEHTEMSEVHPHLDFVNIMTYDFFSSGSVITGHHAGLRASAHPGAPERTVVAAVERHLAAGIPARKIVLGVAFYGRGWSGVQPERRGLNQPYEQFAGAFSYAELVRRFVGKRGFERHWDEAASAPYLWNPDSTTFISYEDPESLRQKVEFVRSRGLGGVMFWEYSNDLNGTLLDVLSEPLGR